MKTLSILVQINDKEFGLTSMVGKKISKKIMKQITMELFEKAYEAIRNSKS
jgi:hypothetical protein